MEAKTKLYKRDFILVVIGQILSLFGNAILRFAVPFYLLKETGSSTLFERYMATRELKESTRINYIRVWDNRVKNEIGNI